MDMGIDIHTLIGEATAYDKKQMLEVRRPKSWLKSVSAFANGEGGVLIFGISDDGQIMGLANAEGDAEKISEEIKSKLDPVPAVKLDLKEADGRKLVLLHVYPGQETPYYYIGDKQRLAFVRIGNESVVADRIQLKSLVLKGAGRTYDSLPSNNRFEDMAFSKLRSVHYKRLQRSFEDSEFVSWGIVDENGNLTNAGALLADESPIRQSRIFCTRWNGLDMTSGLGEAVDDVELEGCVIGQLQDAVSFVRNNSRKKWWKESDHREELPDYPERAVTEAIANAIIHRDYKKIIDSYKRFEKLPNYHAPEFQSNASEFHVILWNLNYENEVIGEITPNGTPLIQEFVKENGEVFVKEFVKGQSKFAKEFVKANRQIYKLISQNPHINAAQMAESMGVSARQVQKYLKRLQESGKITRVGGRKIGEWKIIDEEYEGFFDRI